MPLINFSLTTPKIEPGIFLSSLKTVISEDKIAQAIQESKVQQQRNRSLPTHIVISLIIAMSFWARDSLVDVLKNLLAGLNATETQAKVFGYPGTRKGTKAAFPQARLVFLVELGTLKVIRRAIPLFQPADSQESELFLSWIIAAILDNKIPPRTAC